MVETTAFSRSKVERIRRQARRAWEKPLHEADVVDNWQLSPVDPTAIVDAFPPIELKPGLKLVGYLFQSNRNGNGVVYAAPSETEIHQPTIRWNIFEPPGLPGYLDHVMDAFIGDGSAWSYLCASLLARELAEFGAMWHGVNWGNHQILYGEEKLLARALEKWEWEQPAPKDWRPAVTVDEDHALVRFYTHSGHVSETIRETVDHFQPGSLRFETDTRLIAVGGHGFIY